MRALRRLFALLVLVVFVVAVCAAPATMFAWRRAVTLPWLPAWPALDVGSVVPLAYMVGVILAFERTFSPLRHLATFVHELGHCVAAVAVGASPASIVYQSDASGLAVLEFPHRVGRLRRALVFTAGYLAPGLAAWATLSLTVVGLSRQALLVLALVAAGSLVFLVRNLFGAGLTMFVGLSAWSAAELASVELAAVLLALLSGLLAVRGVFDAVAQLRLRVPGDCDAAQIAEALVVVSWRTVASVQVFLAGLLALLPPVVWLAVWLAVLLR